jgi:hypothetical protein
MTFVTDWRNTLTTDRSVVVLVLVNSLTLIGAIYYGWDVFTLMLLYWLETAIIGFFSVVKLVHSARALAVFLVPFFCVHFGLFMFGHLTFIIALFGGDTIFADTGILEQVTGIISLVAIPATALFASHLYSFLTNYIGRQEYEFKNPMHFFAYPYPRIIVMHLTIIFGGFLTMVLSPVFSLILLSVLKTVADVGAHIKIHTAKNGAVTQASSTD